MSSLTSSEWFTTCSHCGKEKPESEFSPRTDQPGNVTSWCLKCMRERQQERREAERAARPVLFKSVDTEKTCTGECRLTLPLTAFGWKDKKTGRLREMCRTCHNKETRAYKELNREKMRKDGRVYYSDHKRARAEYARTHREENIEEYRERERAWKQLNPEKINSYTHNRRARLNDIPGTHSDSDWEALKASFDYTCLWCRRSEPEIALSRDHIVATTMPGATNFIDNIQPLCGGKLLREGGCQFRKGQNCFDLRPYWPGPLPEFILLSDGSEFSLLLPELKTPKPVERKINGQTEQRCIDCNKVKLITEFNFRDESKGYRKKYCKNPCQVIRNARRYKKGDVA